MNWTILFTIAIILLLLRAFWAHVKANSAKTESFKSLPPKDKLAVLKECLLNNATMANLDNLANFVKEQGLSIETDSYKPLLEKQLELGNSRANYVECDKLYVEQCAWIDKIKPLEFDEAEDALKSGEQCLFVQLKLEGISRLYSDSAIEAGLEELAPTYPKASTLLENYRKLIRNCETCDADDKSLEALRKERDAWIEDLLTIEK